MALTLADIDNAENAVKNIRVVLQGIGREIYKMRNNEELGPNYGFDGYSRVNFSGTHHSGEEGPDWEGGTPIFSLCYIWYRASDVIYVTFPQGWLEQDWRALERARLDEERSQEATTRRAEEEKRARDREESERRTFERLRAKFEPDPPSAA